MEGKSFFHLRGTLLDRVARGDAAENIGGKR